MTTIILEVNDRDRELNLGSNAVTTFDLEPALPLPRPIAHPGYSVPFIYLLDLGRIEADAIVYDVDRQFFHVPTQTHDNPIGFSVPHPVFDRFSDHGAQRLGHFERS